jgi:hypothetical protein
VALVGCHVADKHLSVVKTLGLALGLRVAVAWGTKFALEVRLVANIALNALIGAVDTIASKWVGAIGVEPGTLGTCDVAWINNVLTAPPAEWLSNAF